MIQQIKEFFSRIYYIFKSYAEAVIWLAIFIGLIQEMAWWYAVPLFLLLKFMAVVWFERTDQFKVYNEIGHGWADKILRRKQ